MTYLQKGISFLICTIACLTNETWADLVAQEDQFFKPGSLRCEMNMDIPHDAYKKYYVDGDCSDQNTLCMRSKKAAPTRREGDTVKSLPQRELKYHVSSSYAQPPCIPWPKSLALHADLQKEQDNLQALMYTPTACHSNHTIDNVKIIQESWNHARRLYALSHMN